MRVITRFIFLALLVLASQSALAATVQLYSHWGTQAPNYKELLTGLQPGDQLVFSRGRQFTFDGFLGQGNTTQIISVDQGRRVLRLPLNEGTFGEQHIPYVDYLRKYVEGWAMLKGSDVPLVNVYEDESDPYEFVVAEKLDLKFTMEDLMMGKADYGAEGARAREQIVEFGAATWQFAMIGDFRADQVGWTGSRWVLFDFTDIARPFKYGPAATVWDILWELPRSLRAKIEQRILEKRRAAEPRFCEMLLTAQRGPAPNSVSDMQDPFVSHRTR